jgi:hypothetical protein
MITVVKLKHSKKEKSAQTIQGELIAADFPKTTCAKSSHALK